MFSRRALFPTLLCLTIVGYLFYDLEVTQGRVYNLIAQCLTKPFVQGEIASVYGRPITETEVEVTLSAYLYRRGLDRDSLDATQYDLLFQQCLDECIKASLIAYHTTQADQTIESEQITAEVELDKKQFSDSYEWRDALRRTNASEDLIRARATRHLSERHYLDRVLPSALPAPPLSSPSLIKVRHIFLSTWEKSPTEVKDTLLSSLASLQTGQLTFTELSDRINEDLRAKAAQGVLGWMSDQRLPSGLEGIFELPLAQPTLIQSSLGWHYLEVLEKKPPVTVSQALGSPHQERVAYLSKFLAQLSQESRSHIIFSPSS